MADEESEKSLQSRLDKLGQALDVESATSQKASMEGSRAGNSTAALNLGVQVLGGFVGAVAIGTLLGWQLDKWLGTAPAGLLIFLALGTASGFWNVYRLAIAPPGKPGK